MGRDAGTYRGARRNEARKLRMLDRWREKRRGHGRSYNWPTAMAFRPGKPIWDKPHQGDREKARRRRQMDNGQLTGLGVIEPLDAIKF